MYLEKLEIQGFKSFANKNMLVFPGMVSEDTRGITAVVGPNGSGKSNIADAVRWALGEQSMKTLRGKKGEDVIFSGSDKKGKLGMAEVSLHLNNEDRTVPIDYSQVVLTRRLYRTGESEYLLNNSRVRLADVQMLLAKAKFGQKTYSVIGQGLVEGFLSTSLGERKEFFDEATGVKQFQIKRDESLNKLRASYENLNQVSMLLTEIEPRVKSLTRQVSRLNKRSSLESELKRLQLNYYGKVWHENNDKFNEFNNKYLEQEKEKRDKEKKLETLNSELEKLEKENSISDEYDNWQKELNGLQSQKDEFVGQFAKVNAQLEVKLDSLGKFDLSWLNNKKESLISEFKNINEDIGNLENKIVNEKEKFNSTDERINKLNGKLNGLNQELRELMGKQKDKDHEKTNDILKKSLARIELIQEEKDIEKLRGLVSQVKEDLRNAIKMFEGEVEKERIEILQTNVISISSEKEDLGSSINDSRIRISAWSERVKMHREKEGDIKKELNDIEIKFKQNTKEVNIEDIEKNKDVIKRNIEEVENKISKIKEQVDRHQEREEEERSNLFASQKNIQTIQNILNDTNRQLSDLKINSTRYETRLEDLEIEIRENIGSLKEIKQSRIEGEINKEEVVSKIKNIKHQLDLIGGIDPEIEKEYVDTKGRYDFLSEQVTDLEDAINSLEKVIQELDETIREKFDKEFKVIADKFSEYFKILFNGGNAKIVKVLEQDINGSKKGSDKAIDENGELAEEENKKENNEESGNFNLKKIKFLKKHNATGLAGIEIQANPPGKKISSVSMLSGGERALTAIALISAIISANPSPFVVLDEVDAALDEANSERLAKILDDLSTKTQFIVITHNRASMRRANVLYGVTMGDDSVSKLLSVKLEDVKAG
jgi:chromosome segregation protein